MKIERPLEDGLVLRSLSAGYASDRQQLPDFYVRIFTEDGDRFASRHGAWTRDLMNDHPTTTLDDVWCVVDTRADDKLVSALLLIPQMWCYAGVPFGLGRVELVATDEAYRNRRLVRRMFEVLHERSAELGHMAQGITGIPHYYRRYGYGMSLPLGAIGELPVFQVPKLKDDQQAAYKLRPATDEDIPHLIAWDEAQNGLLRAQRDGALWRYEIGGKHKDSTVYVDAFIIQHIATGEDVGYVLARTFPGSDTTQILAYIVGENSSYLATFDDVLREIKAYGERVHEAAESQVNLIQFSLNIPPAVDMLVRKANGALYPFPYAWYMRVPDLAAFVRHIAPVLEARLAGSAANRFTGEIKLDFYDMTGLHMTFADGKLKSAAGGKIDLKKGVNGAFPDHSFLNLVFGKDSIDDLRAVYPDCWADRDGQIILDVLFPKVRHGVHPVA